MNPCSVTTKRRHTEPFDDPSRPAGAPLAAWPLSRQNGKHCILPFRGDKRRPGVETKIVYFA